MTCNLELDGLQHKVLLSDQREWHPFPAPSAALLAIKQASKLPFCCTQNAITSHCVQLEELL